MPAKQPWDRQGSSFLQTLADAGNGFEVVSSERMKNKSDNRQETIDLSAPPPTGISWLRPPSMLWRGAK